MPIAKWPATLEALCALLFLSIMERLFLHLFLSPIVAEEEEEDGIEEHKRILKAVINDPCDKGALYREQDYRKASETRAKIDNGPLGMAIPAAVEVHYV